MGYRVVLLLGAAALPPAALPSPDLPPSRAQATPVSPAEVAASRRWDQSAYGNMLRRILPPGPDPKALPEPDSAGARLLARYCVQCHYLPSPAMHAAERWPQIVERMVWRMEGKGNLGKLMREMMGRVEAPTAEEKQTLIAYLQRHGQNPLDPALYPDLKTTPEGQVFDIACSQCHELPDPKRHTAREWPRVVERMQKNLVWVGWVTGKPELDNPQPVKVEEILKFLKRHSRDH